jgi:hypothetical protein
MRKDNPACYECPRARSRLHWWLRKAGTNQLVCEECRLVLSQEDSDDCRRG